MVRLVFHDDDTKAITRSSYQYQNPFEQFLLKYQNASSAKTMANALEAIAKQFFGCTAREAPWHTLTSAETMVIRKWLIETKSPSTTNNWLSALRGILKTCLRLELIGQHEYSRAVMDLDNLKYDAPPAGRAVNKAEVSNLFELLLSDGLIGLRDLTTIVLLYGCGLRRAEASSLTMADVNLETGSILVHGKGNKIREVPLNDKIAQVLGWWAHARGDKPGFFLTKMRKGDKIVLDEQFEGGAIYDMITRRMREMGMEHASPHDFRRSFITDMLDAGAGEIMVSSLVGHSDPKTTKRYDRRGDKERKKAMKLRDVPI